MKIIKLQSGILFSSLFLISCAPKFYVVDRQTVLEQEAAGEWPQYDNVIASKKVVTGPVPIGKTALNNKKSRLYQVLNGTLVDTNTLASANNLESPSKSGDGKK